MGHELREIERLQEPEHSEFTMLHGPSLMWLQKLEIQIVDFYQLGL